MVIIQSLWVVLSVAVTLVCDVHHNVKAKVRLEHEFCGSKATELCDPAAIFEVRKF